MADDLGRVLRGADGPRPLPAPLRARLDAALRTGVARPAARSLVDELAFAGLFEGIDGPRALPGPARARLARRLGSHRPQLLRRVLASAAVLIVFAASAVAIVQRPDQAAPDTSANPPPFTAPLPPLAPAPGAGFGAGGVAVDPGAGDPSAPIGLPAVEPPAPADAGPAPPFAFATAPSYGAPVYADGGSSPAPRTGPPVRLGVVRGDPQMEAGFEGYVRLLNEGGGVRGRRVRLIEVSPDAPARNVLVTVNLSGAALDGTPEWTLGPILEGLDATESQQRDRVLSFASPPERQAHLLALALTDGDDDPATAAIYHEPDGVYGRAVPDALAEVLTARGVAVVRIAYEPGDGVFVPADVALLSLRAPAARAWLAESAAAGHQPRAGIGGIASLLTRSLARALDGRDATVVGPYARPSTIETTSSAFGGAHHDVARAHGWVTAKNIAVAIWQNDAHSPEAMRVALDRLAGYENGFAPAYERREGSNARTPEGMVFTVEQRRFVARSGFLRDPF